MTAPSISLPQVDQAARPGLRTFRSRRFRMLVGGLLLIVGVAILGSAMARQAAQPTGQFAIDFVDYQVAAQRVAAGESPYAADMLNGPVDAQGQNRYRYPPPLAQLLAPIAGLPLGTAASIWLLLQAAAVLVAVWIAGTAGGAARSPERLLWSAVAATWFLPTFDTLWKGNVSGFVALAVAAVAVAGAAGAVAALGGAALKLVPLTLVPVAFLTADRRQRLLGVVVAVVAILVSIALSPRAWADYAVVLPNLFAGSADYVTNLAPAAVATHIGFPNVVLAAIRVGTLVVALGAFAGSVALARRPAGRHAALVLATVAMLLLPAALWYHYLVVLLPLAALAWPRAATRVRTMLVGGAVAIGAALAWSPLALVGAALMVAAALVATWPRAITNPVALR